MIVHQFDAHAWAEVWLVSRGWVRVDPTAAVSPQRIEFGLEEAMESEGSFLSTVLLSPLRYRSIPLLNLLRLRYDALTYQWQTWVVGFDNERQFDLLRSFFGETTTKAFAIVLLGSWALVLLPVAISLFLARDIHPVSPMGKHYRIFCKRLARLDLIRGPGETPCQFAQRAAKALPDYADSLWQITELYNQLAYADAKSAAGNAAQDLQHFVRMISRFRPKRHSAALTKETEW